MSDLLKDANIKMQVNHSRRRQSTQVKCQLNICGFNVCRSLQTRSLIIDFNRTETGMAFKFENVFGVILGHI